MADAFGDAYRDAAQNCANAKFPAGATRRVISATSLGIERIVELVIPPGS